MPLTSYSFLEGSAATGRPYAFTGAVSVVSSPYTVGMAHGFIAEASGTILYGQVLEQVDRNESTHVDDSSFARDAHGKELPLWKKIRAITAAVPAAEWESVPRDLASNVDKYLYRKDDKR